MLQRIIVFSVLACAAAVPAAAQTRYEWSDPELAKEAQRCSSYSQESADDFANMHRQGMTLAETEAYYAKRIADDASTSAFCLGNLRARAPKDAALLKRAAAAAEADARASIVAAKEAFLANPSGYMWIGNPELKDRSAAAMKRDVGVLKRFKTLAQTCGTFDYSMPYVDNKILNRRHNERRAYVQCVIAYRDGEDGMPFSIGFNLESTREELDSFAPYICSRYKVKGCIKDNLWRQYDAVATNANIAVAKRVSDLKYSEKRKANEEVGRTNDWTDQVNKMVDDHNRSVRGY